LIPKRLSADTAYGIGRFLAVVTGAGIISHIPVWDKSERDDGTFSRSEFEFDSRRNVYICPAGATLTTGGRVTATMPSGTLHPCLAAGSAR
jgi:hypothetical protein